MLESLCNKVGGVINTSRGCFLKLCLRPVWTSPWRTKKTFTKFLLDVTHLVKAYISLVFTKSHLFLFVFIWDMELLCILVFKLESYKYFKPVFVEVLCHSFIRFARVIFFPMKLYNKIYFHGKFIIESIIGFLFYSHTCSLGWIKSLLNKTCFSLV